MVNGYYCYPQIDYCRTGKNLKRLCEESGYTVKDVQRALGLGSNQAIYDWFNGKNLPSLNNFFALCRILHASMDDLIVEKASEKPQEPEALSVELVYMRSNRDYMRAAEYRKIVREAS
ncbi:MAG: helix-turn-helix domain-containing protein [Clostridiales bacterium]|nr:helix-turn-helix domain-containing protein [Clostridiales bacterium]